MDDDGRVVGPNHRHDDEGRRTHTGAPWRGPRASGARAGCRGADHHFDAARLRVAVPLVFAAAGANDPHGVRAVRAWRNRQFSMPTLARLACDAPLILERRQRTEELTSAE
jgi:hypothetical protein